MATQGDFTIGGTSPDYATIQAWADSPTGNLTGVYRGLIREGTYAPADINTGVTTGASAYMELTPDTGAHHGGVMGAGVVIDGKEGPTNYNLLIIRDDYTRVSGISFTQANGQSGEAIDVQADEARLEELLAWNLPGQQQDFIYIGGAAGTSAITMYVSNCHAYYVGRAFFHIQGTDTVDGGTFYIYNCTALFTSNASIHRDGAAGSEGGIRARDSVTTGRTFHVKNCYMHLSPQKSWVTSFSGARTCYAKHTNDSWGNSTNNASSDSTAPGTNPQTGLSSPSTELEVLPTEETIGDDDGASAFDYDCGENRLEGHINKNAATTSASTLKWETNQAESPVQVRNILARMDLSNFPSVDRVLVASWELTSDGDVNSSSFNLFSFLQMDRNWTSGATWNDYDGTNPWATAGGLGSADYVESDDATNFDGQGMTGSVDLSAGDDVSMWVSNFASWVKDAIDGTGPSPVGANYIDFMAVAGDGGEADDPLGFDGSTNGTVANRPHFRIIYQSAQGDPDWRPASGGSLDGNGTDLSGDTDYAIAVDVTGGTRSGWDIGAFAEGVVVSGSATDGIDLGDTATAILRRPLQGKWHNEQFETNPGTDETYIDSGATGTSTLDRDFPTSSVTGAPEDWGTECAEFSFVDGEDTYLEIDEQYVHGLDRIRVEFIVPSGSPISSPSLFVSAISPNGTQSRLYNSAVTTGGILDYRISSQIYHDSTQNTYTSDVEFDVAYRVEFVWDTDSAAWEYSLIRLDTNAEVDSQSGTLTGGAESTYIEYRYLGIGDLDIAAGETYTLYMDNVYVYDGGGVFAEDGADLGDTATANITVAGSATDGIDVGDSISHLALETESVPMDQSVLGDSATANLTVPGSCTDGAVLGDSATVNIVKPESASDGIDVGDSITEASISADVIPVERMLMGDSATMQFGAETIQESASDGVDLGDTATEALTVPGDASDETWLGDSATFRADFTDSAADGSVVGDLATAALTLALAAAAGLSLGGSATGSVVRSAQAADGIRMGDTATANVIRSEGASDGVELGDSATIRLDASDSATDGVSLGDSATVTITFAEQTQDGLNLGDSATATVAGQFAGSAEDGVQLGDSAESRADFTDSTSDGVELGDSIAGAISADVIPVERMLMGDSATVNITTGIVAANASDGIELGDTATEALTAPESAQDGVDLGDTASVDVTAPESVADGIELGDTAAAGITVPGTVSDGAVLGDAATARIDFAVDAQDGLFLGDTATAEIGGQVAESVSDGVDLGDTADARADYTADAQDGVSLGDSATGTLTIPESASDGVELGDSADAALTKAEGADEGIVLGDTATATITFAIDAQDGLALGDSATAAQTGLTVGLADDGVELGDTAVVQLSLGLAVSDGVELGDTATADLVLPEAATDGVALGDAADEAVTRPGTAQDGIQLGDAAAVAVDATESVTDGAVLGDTATATVSITPSVSDGAVLGDSATASVRIPAGPVWVSDATFTVNTTDSATISLVTSNEATMSVLQTDSGTLILQVQDAGTMTVKAKDEGVMV